MQFHKRRQSIVFEQQPAILSSAAIGGKKESEGPLASYFDRLNTDTKFGQKSWEKAESKMQELALDTARRKLELQYGDIDVLFGGDLLNQCIGSAFALRPTGIPYLGLYGACSTMAESLLLAAAAVNAGYARRAAALTSSHFASAERQYRFPLGYGGQRTPTAQWTVTGAGCCIVGSSAPHGPFVRAATVGAVTDWGIKDANNMGAAMASAAYATLRAHFDDLGCAPEDYDLTVHYDSRSTIAGYMEKYNPDEYEYPVDDRMRRLIATAWQIAGIVSPCQVEVGDMSAPVAQNRRFLSLPFVSCDRRYPQSTLALHPQPEPPACTSCVCRS